MQLVNMDVERHGPREPFSLGPLSPGLNALYGPAGSGKTTLLWWLRQVAREDQQRGRGSLDTAWDHTRPALHGSVEVANRGLRFRLSSHSPVLHGRSLNSYSENALPLDQARNNLTARQLAAFAAMASTNHAGEVASNEPTGEFESGLKTAAERLGLDVQPASLQQPPEREQLLTRQREIESRLQQLDQLHLSLEAQILSARNQLDALVDRYSVFQERGEIDKRHGLRDQRDLAPRRGYGDRRIDYAVHQDSSGRTHIVYAGDYFPADSSNLSDTLRSMQRDLYEACQQMAQLDQCEDRERLLREADELRQRLATLNPVYRQGSRFHELVHRHIAGLLGGRERISSRAAYRNLPQVDHRRYDLVDGIVYDQERRVETEVPAPLVGVAQRLAIAEAMAARSEPVPVLIDEALDHLSQDDQVAAIAYLAHVAAAGQQILLMTGSQSVAELVRQQHGWVAYLKPNATPAMDINRQLTAVANDYEASKWFQPNVYSEPLRSATLTSPLYLTERSRIEESPSIDEVLAARLRAVGIDRIGDLLDVDPHWLAEQLRQDGVSDATVASWQAEARLLCSVRQLRPFDARLLVSIGVRTPQQLADMHPSQLLDRVERFVATDRGRRFLRSGSSYELSRITNWIASAKGGAGRFQGSSFVDHGWAGSHDEYDRDALDGYRADYEDEFSSPRRQGTSRRSSDREGNSQRQQRPSASSRSDRSRSPAYPNLHRTARSATTAERNARPEAASEEPGARQPRARLDRKARERRHPEAIKLAETARLKFYLELASPVVDAPSIGPRMAARLENLGIFTVDQLLAANATALTDKLNLRRIDAATIRVWQEQARLVCRIPNLRGHDAQLLVACNLTSPEELAAMQAATVLKQVLVVAESNEGQRILRGSKQPDLAEVNDWIDWASQCRSLNAA